MSYITIEPEPGQSDRINVPRGPLIGAGLLTLLVFTLAISARVFGFGHTPEPVSTVQARRTLRFEDATDGGIIVTDVKTDSLVLTLPSGYNGFVRGALRAMARERMIAKVPKTAPFVLTLWADGRLTLDDPSTKGKIEVSSFGPVQMESFAQLLVPDKQGRILGVPTAGTPASKAFTAPMGPNDSTPRLLSPPPASR
jgi:putative photosynthetic complex assembly protein